MPSHPRRPCGSHLGRHDRWFLDRIATTILAFAGESRMVWFEGNSSGYEGIRKARLGEGAVQPQRIEYRRFPRTGAAE